MMITQLYGAMFNYTDREFDDQYINSLFKHKKL